MTSVRQGAAWVGSLAVVAALGGCVTLGIGNSGTAVPSSSTATVATSIATSPASRTGAPPTSAQPRGTAVANSPTTPKSSPPPPTNLTPPGTELKLGQPATAVYESLGQVNNVEVTVVSITKGQQSDLARFDIKDAALKQATPFYVVSQYTVLAGEKISVPIMDSRLGATDQNGSKISSITLFGTLSQCEGDRVDDLMPGDSYKDCRVFMAPPGSDVVAVSWSGDYSTKPFIWKA